MCKRETTNSYKMASNESTLQDEPQSKKSKLDNGNATDGSVHEKLKDLSTFSLEKIINNNTKGKTVCLQGTFDKCEGTGLVILEKTAFEESNLHQNSEYFTGESLLKKLFHNDIYGNYEFLPKIELNTLKTTIIHPATQKHIEKYSIQKSYIIKETPDIYNNIVLPHINSEQQAGSNLQWVYNILEHKSEVERIAFEDSDPKTGFILLPDLKWNNESVETLYFLAIVHDKHIKSIRDLTEEHLPLLRNIKEKAEITIEEKYGLTGSQLRTYIHYHPSFYHFHVHITNLRHEGPGILAERAHMLTTVINNIELVGDYYQRASIPVIVRENDKLLKKLEEKNIIKKSVQETES